MSYMEAKEKYAALGVDVEAAMEQLKTVPVSLDYHDYGHHEDGRRYRRIEKSGYDHHELALAFCRLCRQSEQQCRCSPGCVEGQQLASHCRDLVFKKFT